MSTSRTRRVASIDIGTNSVRVLLAEVGPAGALRTRLRQGTITRLGQGMVATGAISDEACARTIEAVRNFVEEAEYGGAQDIVITGTSAFREASNGASVAMAIGEAVGYDVRILSGEEEARMVYSAVAGARSGPCVVIDIGGGSTEVIAHDRDAWWVRSMQLGAVSATEQFLAVDPPTEEEHAALREHVEGALTRHLAGFQPPAGAQVFGVGGTVTALAAVHKGLVRYDPAAIEGEVIPLVRMRDIAETLWRIPLGDRQTIPGVNTGRADIILAGSTILLALLARLGVQSLTASTRGLRYGILYDLLSRDSS